MSRLSGAGASARRRAALAPLLVMLSACGGASAVLESTAQPDPNHHQLRLPPVQSPSDTPSPSATATPTARAPHPPSFTHVSATATPGPINFAPVTGPVLGSCPVFPANNPWNQDISRAAVDPKSAAYIGRIDSFRQFLHPDFGSDPSYGIPYDVIQASPFVPITFTAYGSESDPGPYPIPLNAPIEQGSDAHVLVADSGSCHLYELFNARRQGSGWAADSGAIFDLRSNALRPDGWTSADAAGLPILPGLVRYDEVASGVINHALRFTVSETQDGFIHPATHQAGVANLLDPPMGLRLRLKASFDLSPYHGAALVILTALERYGMFVADNGSSWFVSGSTDSRWNDADLGQLKLVPGSDFEVVQTGPIQH